METTVATPQQNASQAPAAASDREAGAPVLVTPVGGGPADGAAATFAWHPAEGAKTYRLEVAADPSFEHLLYDIAVGTATSLTLYDLLPESDGALYWRVEAVLGEGRTVWSEAASFRPASDEEVAAFRRRKADEDRTRRIRERQQRPPDAAVEAAVPADTGFTSRREMVGILSFLILSFIATVVLLFSISFNMG